MFRPSLSVGDAAREIGARRKDISMLFYLGEFRDDLCPVIAGRRIIPRDYLPIIVMALKKRQLQVRELPKPAGVA